MSLAEETYLGIDIGGTKTNIGLVDAKGTVLTQKKTATSVKTGPQWAEENIQSIIEDTKEVVATLQDNQQIRSIGIGVPGTVNWDLGEVVFAPNLHWRNIPIRDIFEDVFGIPVFIGQDTQAAAWGEFLYGAGQGLRDIACITIGTGIGCGLVIGGHLYRGRFGTAGEIGHTVVEKEGLPCNCGKNGCVEVYASGTAILNRFRLAVEAGQKTSLLEHKQPDELTTFDIFAGAGAHDPLAQEIIGSAVEYLSMALTNLINLFGPEAVILSGGIGEQRALYVEPLIQRTYARIYSILMDKTKITPARLGANAPLIGAAMLFRDAPHQGNKGKGDPTC
jgi:glucokinase